MKKSMSLFIVITCFITLITFCFSVGCQKKFQITGMAITRIADGKIIEDETYWNVLGLYQQLGFTLNPPQEQK